MSLPKSKIFNLWIALTFVVLFFYPLFSTLHDNFIILQWRFKNTMELVLAIVLFTSVLAPMIWLIHNKINDRRKQVVLLCIIFFIPFISFFVHLFRQLGFVGELISFGEYASRNKLYALLLFLALLLMFLIMVFRYPKKVLYLLYIIFIALSSLNIVAMWTILSHLNTNTKISITGKTNNPIQSRTNSNKQFVIILFDELSYDYLYKTGSIDSRFPNFKNLSLISDNYHRAISPGKQTLTAIPGLLTNRRYDNLVIKYDWIYRITKEQKEAYLKIDKNNLFATAQSKGLKTFAVGNYLPYCEMFEHNLDECRSFSEYNYGGVNTGFSIMNPVITTLNIWPRQKPQGIIKNLAASSLQKKRIKQTIDFILDILKYNGDFFLFAHIYLPHLPFVFNKNGFYRNKEPFLQNDENYIKQVEYCDVLLGKIIEKLKELGKFDSSEIIVLSDHNYRLEFPGRENSIPLIVKQMNSKTRKDIYETVRAEELLNKELEKFK